MHRCAACASSKCVSAQRLARHVGFGGSYLRFEGVATVEKIEGGEVVESVSDHAVWELMYFGKSYADEKYREK